MQKQILQADPFRCRMWNYHDRLETHVTEASCHTEIESIKTHGQLVPVLGRPLDADPHHNVELIFGARRLFVARCLKVPLLVELKKVTDLEALIAMDAENRLRKDISPYERGLSYARWLRTGFFSSQEEVARHLKISASQVSRLLRMAQLPAVIVNAFASPLDLCEGWGLALTEALQDPVRRHLTLRTARLLGHQNPRLPARDVYQQLIGATVKGRRVKQSAHDEVVKDDTGAPMFRIRRLRNSVALVVPLARMSPGALERMRLAISGALRAESVHSALTG